MGTPSKKKRREKREMKSGMPGRLTVAEQQAEHARAQTMQAGRDKKRDDAAKLATDAEVKAVDDMEQTSHLPDDPATYLDPPAEKPEPRKHWWNR